MKIRHFIFAAALAASPLTGALAQGNSPTAGAADTKSSDPKPANSAATNSKTPGATGSTVVPGSNSTISGDKAATADAKTGGTNTGSGGGGGK